MDRMSVNSKRTTSGEPGTPNSRGSEPKKAKQATHRQQTLSDFVSGTPQGTHKRPGEELSVTIEEEPPDEGSNGETSVGGPFVDLLLSPPKVPREKDTPYIPPLHGPVKKSPAAEMNLMNCIFDWTLEGPTIKAEVGIKMPPPATWKPFTSYQGRDDPECIQQMLKVLVPPLFQALQPDRMVTDKTELKEQEYFDLFTAVFRSTATWDTADLKRTATRMRGVVYRLALTSPEVFESLWTKTGRLNIIEETKAWKAANRLVGSSWELHTPIAPKQITFTEIATKAATPVQKDTSKQSTKTTVNPYIKQFEAWTKKVSKLNTVTRKYTTYFSLKLPPAKVVDLAPDGGCSLFATALMALRTVDPDIVLYPYPSEADQDEPKIPGSTPLIKVDPKHSSEIRKYTDRYFVGEQSWTYCRIKVGHDVEHEEFNDPEFQKAIKLGHLSISIAGIQAPYIMAVGWLFGSHVVTLNCPDYEAKLRKHHLMKDLDLEVKPDRVLMRPEERRYTDRIFPRAAHIYCSKKDASRVRKKLQAIYNLITSKEKPDDKDFRFIPTVLEAGKPLQRKRFNDALRSRQRQMEYIRKLESMEVPYCHELDTPITCAAEDAETRQITLREALLCWSISNAPEQPLFIFADRDFQGIVRVTFKQVFKSEAHQTIANLPILLAHRFGPRAWGWFDKEAAQENLANVYFDAAINQIVEQATSEEANVYAVRGESDDQENLSEMMQTMAFENLDDESVNNEDAMDVVEFDLEFQVDPSRRFEALPAFDSLSQASFATMSTAGASMMDTEPPIPAAPDPATGNTQPPISTPFTPADVSQVTGDDASTTVIFTGSTLTTPSTINVPIQQAPRQTGSKRYE